MLSLIIALRYFQDTLSELGVDKLLCLMIALLDSLVKNKAYTDIGLDGNVFKMLELICQFCTMIDKVLAIYCQALYKIVCYTIKLQ